MIFNLELRPELRRPREPSRVCRTESGHFYLRGERHACGVNDCPARDDRLQQRRRYPDMTRLFAAMEERKRRQPLRQVDIDRVTIDRSRYFAHRCQISTTVDNTYWRRYRELPSRPGINPWLCLGMIAAGIYGLYLLL